MTQVQSVTDATFQREVIESTMPVLVDFWAPWCAPCRAMAPVLDDVAREQGARLRVVKFNLDEGTETANKYRVASIPTMMLFRGGQPVTEVVGPKGKAALLRELEPYLQAG